jgi:TIR domain
MNAPFRKPSDQTGELTVPQQSINRVWQPSAYRVFLSHKSSVKNRTARLKEELAVYGITAFVAHRDIEPTKAWQTEIENALQTMDAFVALITKHFHESDWTDQEVGYALARGVPIIPVTLGHKPYGFLEKFQGLGCTWQEAPVEIAKLLIRQPLMLDAYIANLRNCKRFDDGNTLSNILPSINSLTPKQEKKLVEEFNSNYELKNSFGFNGRKVVPYGGGIPLLLKRLNGKTVTLNEDNDLRFVPSPRKQRS